MPRGGAKKHIHKYKRLIRAELWMCGEPNCTHYMPRNLEEGMEGRLSKCWDCEMPFTLDSRALKLVKPVCQPCELKIKEVHDPDGILRFIRDLEESKKLESEVTDKTPSSAAEVIKNITGPIDPFGD